jgi:putative toxin-antitoxin system antitoxin component (TIGR02293 family)
MAAERQHVEAARGRPKVKAAGDKPAKKAHPKAASPKAPAAGAMKAMKLQAMKARKFTVKAAVLPNPARGREKPVKIGESQTDDALLRNMIQTIADLLGGTQVLGSTVESELEAHELLSRGLPRAALSNLINSFHIIRADEVSEAIGVSLRTLQRHKHAPSALLNAPQSGRTWTFAEILTKATRVLGSQDEAEQWLERPAIGLDQRRPIDLLTTPAGVKLVEDYLGRLEYGVYT